MAKFLDKTGLDTLWAKIKSTFQTLGNLVTAWGSTPSDTKYPSEKLVKDSLDGKLPKTTKASEIISSAYPQCFYSTSYYDGGYVLFYDVTSAFDGTFTSITSDQAHVAFSGFVQSAKYNGYGGPQFFNVEGKVNGKYPTNYNASTSKTYGPVVLKRTYEEDGVTKERYYFAIKVPANYKHGMMFFGVFHKYGLSGTALSWDSGFLGNLVLSTDTEYSVHWSWTAGYNVAAEAGTAAGYTSGGAIDTALQGKVDKKTGMGLSTNDYTTDEKDKLAGIADGAEVNVQSDWNQATTTADDYIKNKPQNMVQDASYVHTDNNYTTDEKTKLSGIAEGAEVNVQSDWNQTSSTADDYIKNKPTVSRYFNKYSGGTSVYGWKIGSTVTRNAEGVSSIITGVFTLALGIRVENAPQESTAVKTNATMVGFFSCYARYESGANVVKARIYTPVSSIFNATFNLKYIDEGNGKFTWVLGFGTGTTPESKNFVYCSVNVMSSINADFENFGDAITSAPTYPSGAYFTVFKSPVIGQNTSGVGDATKPVYVDTNGFIKECTSVNADTVDGFHFSTSTSGSATNTVYLV